MSELQKIFDSALQKSKNNSITCPNCNSPIRSHDEYCSVCGYNLLSTSEDEIEDKINELATGETELVQEQESPKDNSTDDYNKKTSINKMVKVTDSFFDDSVLEDFKEPIDLPKDESAAVVKEKKSAAINKKEIEIDETEEENESDGYFGTSSIKSSIISKKKNPSSDEKEVNEEKVVESIITNDSHLEENDAISITGNSEETSKKELSEESAISTDEEIEDDQNKDANYMANPDFDMPKSKELYIENLEETVKEKEEAIIEKDEVEEEERDNIANNDYRQLDEKNTEDIISKEELVIEEKKEEGEVQQKDEFDIKSFLSDLEKMQLETPASFVQMNKREEKNKTKENSEQVEAKEIVEKAIDEIKTGNNIIRNEEDDNTQDETESSYIDIEAEMDADAIIEEIKNNNNLILENKEAVVEVEPSGATDSKTEKTSDEVEETKDELVENNVQEPVFDINDMVVASMPVATSSMSDIYSSFKETTANNNIIENEETVVTNNGEAKKEKSIEIGKLGLNEKESESEEDNDSNVEELLAEIKKEKEPPKEKEKNINNMMLLNQIDRYTKEIENELEHQGRTLAKENYFSLTEEIKKEDANIEQNEEIETGTFEWKAFNQDDLVNWEEEETLLDEQMGVVNEPVEYESDIETPRDEDEKDDTIEGMFTAVDDLILSENLNTIFGDVGKTSMEDEGYNSIENEIEEIDRAFEGDGMQTDEKAHSGWNNELSKPIDIDRLKVDNHFKEIIKKSNVNDEKVMPIDNIDDIEPILFAESTGRNKIKARNNEIPTYENEAEDGDVLDQVPIIEHKVTEANDYFSYINSIVKEEGCHVEEPIRKKEEVEVTEEDKETDMPAFLISKKEKTTVPEEIPKERTVAKKKVPKKKYVMELKIDKTKLK